MMRRFRWARTPPAQDAARLLAAAPLVAATSPIRSIGVGATPIDIALNPATNTLYVTNDGGDSVSVIPTGAQAVSTTVALPPGSAPTGVAVNPQTNTIYVANSGAARVTAIRGSSNAVANTINVGIAPGGVAVSPDTNTVYVANRGGGVSVIDGNANAVTRTLSPDRFSQPVGVAVNPATNTAYVTNLTGVSVTVINGTNQATVAGVSVGSKPFPIAVDPTSNQIYAGNYGRCGNAVGRCSAGVSGSPILSAPSSAPAPTPPTLSFASPEGFCPPLNVTCFPNQQCCLGGCTDVSADNDNCGGCDIACTGGATCAAGQCCSPAQQCQLLAGPVCCPPDATCSAAGCCPAGRTVCNSICCGGACCDAARCTDGLCAGA